MPTIHAFHITPALPASLSRLRSIAYNLHWAWEPETVELFRRLDRNLWETSGHNPVQMLGAIAQERLQDAASDESYLADVDRLHYSLESYLASSNTWYRREWADKLPPETRIAYFCMEFGITECLPIYSGGLGVLAGDHLKSASDLGLPLAGVGLLYQQGYFRQALSVEGWQQERYPENDFYTMPIQPVETASGEPLKVSIDFPGRTLYIRVWVAQVGRVPLYLLDTNISENSHEDQNITDQLYGGDAEMRVKQEMVLGIGGMRALEAMGIEPTLTHMNEGHSAFLALERARMLREKYGCDFATARELSASGSLFTTHTPVPAGFDVFSPELLGRYFGRYLEQLGMPFDEFMGLGRVNQKDGGEQFNMAVLAVRTAHHVNGVSMLHGKVTRRMMQAGYPGFPEEEVPATHVTNGIHTRSFVSQEMGDLLDRYLGGRWSQDVSGESVWARVEDIPDEEIWRIKDLRREKLVRFARARLKAQAEQRSHSSEELMRAATSLSPNVLTIGFARRFATYKRATLLLSDPDRLLRLLNDPQRPVQILMAGKAHPKDTAGKELMRQIVEFSRRPEANGRIVFLEDYDLTLARQLVQGVDVWLNTPRRPQEASGTSGMKVLANGGLNVSILDGWWAEGYDPRAGWAIGREEEYSDPGEQDKMEALSLFDILEKEVAPLFYDRGANGVPKGWITRVKSSMRLLCPVYNTHRMVSEYACRFYFPGTARYLALEADNLKRVQALVEWKRKVRDAWPQVKISEVSTTPEAGTQLEVGDVLKVTAKVMLHGLDQNDVSVQIYYGGLGSDWQVKSGVQMPLNYVSREGDIQLFEGEVVWRASGMQGFSVRVLPANSDAELPQELPLISWEP